jgi:hypothetical protein
MKEYDAPMSPEESTAAVRMAAGVLFARLSGDLDGGLAVMEEADPRHLAFGMTIVADIAVNLAAMALGQPVRDVAERIALQCGGIAEDEV